MQTFSDIAAPWRAAGWLGTMPLPERRKFPPPENYTGKKATRILFASDEQVARWSDCAKYRNANIGMALGFPVIVDGIEYEVLALDADQYPEPGKRDKHGGDQLAALESELGPLPLTWVSTARARNDDGTDRGDWLSGIRFYLVPVGLAWPSKADKTAPDVDVIQRGQRYAVVWPSFNPKSGTTYRLYSPTQWAAHGQPSSEVPDPATLPLLPDAWIDRLTQNRMRDSPRPIDTDSSLGELEAWALDQFQDAETMCRRVAGQLAKRKESISNAADSHEQLINGHMEFVHLAGEGHTGWLTAINETTEYWIQDVSGRDKREYGVLRGEIFRELTNAFRKKKRQNGSQHLGRTLCTCDDIDPPARAKRNAPLDLRELRTTPPQPISWLLPDVLPHDSYVSLSAAPGTGKSLLTRAIAVSASLGRSAFDPAHELEPARVIYLDAENGQDWWRAGLDAMDAPLDLPNLSVVCYPDVGGLDTPNGAREFLALVSDLAGELDGVDLVVLDTVSRFIEGGENDADTWSQFYRLAIAPLRDQKVSVLRLDHLGKDADKGPRGSSHKLSDVDADYRMTAARAGSDDLTLTLGKRRRQHFAEAMTVVRKDGPLRHELRTSAASFVVRTADGTVTAIDPETNALVAELDRLDVATAFGREKAKAAYKQAGGTLTADNQHWTAAVGFRKKRAKQSNPAETERDSVTGEGSDDGSK